MALLRAAKGLGVDDSPFRVSRHFVMIRPVHVPKSPFDRDAEVGARFQFRRGRGVTMEFLVVWRVSREGGLGAKEGRKTSRAQARPMCAMRRGATSSYKGLAVW